MQKISFLCFWCDLGRRIECECALFIKTTKLHMCFEIFGVRTMLLSNRVKEIRVSDHARSPHPATMAARHHLVVERHTHVAQNERIKVKIPSDRQSATWMSRS